MTLDLGIIIPISFYVCNMESFNLISTSLINASNLGLIYFCLSGFLACLWNCASLLLVVLLLFMSYNFFFLAYGVKFISDFSVMPPTTRKATRNHIGYNTLRDEIQIEGDEEQPEFQRTEQGLVFSQ